MELLDRYLQAVKKYLPKKRRDDIVEELRANILSQVEDKESELGRPLNLDEEEVILKQHGHPLLVGVRYFPKQYLIGPSVFPYYWYALKTVLAIATLVYAVATGALFVVQNASPGEIIAAVLRFPGILLDVAAWVTLVFVVLEFTWDRVAKKFDFLESWSPRLLEPLEPESDRRNIHPMGDFIASFFFAIYVLMVALHPYLLIGPGAWYFKNSPFQVTPALLTVGWAIVGLIYAQAIVKGFYLAQPSWRRYRPIVSLIFSGAGLVILVHLMNVRDYVMVRATTGDLLHYQQSAEALNRAILLGIKVMAFIMVLTILCETWRLIEGRVHPLASLTKSCF